MIDDDRIGRLTYQNTETICVTAKGDETYGELRALVALLLPKPFEAAGGLHRLRKGDLVDGTTDRYHESDRQAHVAFVAHHPRRAYGKKT